MLTFISNQAHYTEVLQRACSVKKTLWIGTADIKDLYVETRKAKRPFLALLAELIKKGVEVRLIHAKEPGPAFREDFDKYLDEQLEKLGTDHIDFYLLHALSRERFEERVKKFNLTKKMEEAKAAGKIRYLGFSFHAGPELLDQLLTEHPDVDFVQLQINYADWENPSVHSKANYEVARKHGKSIVVMEPVKGGNLANPPDEVKKLMKSCRPEMSYASWAIRFAASLDGMITVLSGMSNTKQMQDNISYMKDFQPLTEEEQKIIQQAQRILGNSSTIPCTSCHYCTKGCPKNIPIPEIFAAMNQKLGNGQAEQAAASYRQAVEKKGAADDCIHCRQCEKVCPQHLPVTQYLDQCKKIIDG